MARVGGLSRVGALSNVQNNVKIWALFLSERLGWALFREWAVFQEWALFQAYTVILFAVIVVTITLQ